MDSSADQTLRAGGLPVLSTGLNLAELDLHGNEDFWLDVQRFSLASQIDRQIDVVMGGRSAPRIWAFLESPGAGPTAAAAALAAAWILAERGQKVVLVDADEQEPRITRWLGRTEQEGWIDMVRFGASLQAASVPVPSDGRHGAVLCVGTFTPTGITADEVADLVNRLRRQADDLILVLPVKLRSLPWIETAHIRLLCWDLLSRSTEQTEAVLAEMDRMGARPDALLGFGVEECFLIQESLREEPVLLPPAAEKTASEAVAEEEADKAADVAPVVAPDVTQDVVAEMEVGDERLPADTGPVKAVVAAGQDPPRRRASRAAALAAVVAVVALAVLGYLFRGQLGWLDGREDTVATVEPVVQVIEVGRPDAGTRQPGDPEVAADLEETAPEPVAPDEPSAPEQPVAEILVETEEAAPAEWSAFRREAGHDGWTLWIYSVASESGAASEVRRLDRLGIQAASRVVELPELGRRWRIYAGSFSSRDEAEAAAAALLAELKHDWAVPVRF